MEWMAWTWPTAIFFASVALLIGAMALAEGLRPTAERRGFLPIVTTRGDRLFIGLLAAAFLNMVWLAFVDASSWWALLLSLCLVILIGRRG